MTVTVRADVNGGKDEQGTFLRAPGRSALESEARAARAPRERAGRAVRDGRRALASYGDLTLGYSDGGYLIAKERELGGGVSDTLLLDYDLEGTLLSATAHAGLASESHVTHDPFGRRCSPDLAAGVLRIRRRIARTQGGAM